MRVKPASLFLIFILVAMLGTILVSISFREFDALLAPLLISVIVFLLAAVEFVRELRADHEDVAIKSAGSQSDGEERKSDELNRFGSAMAWICGFAVGISLLGFYIAIPVFALAYMKRKGRSAAASVIFAACLTLFIYIVFEIGLKSQLYRGLVLNVLL